jgi:hypothetical protein
MEADWLVSRLPGDLLDQRQPLPEEEEEEDSSEVLDFSVFADTGLDFEDLFNSEDLFGPDSAHYRAEDFSCQLVAVQPDTSNNNVKLLASQAASINSNSITVVTKCGALLGNQEELAVERGTQQQQQRCEQLSAEQQQLCLQAQKNVLPAVAEASSFRKVKSPPDSAATTAQPRTDTLDGGGGAVAPRSSAAAPGRISNSGGKRPVLPLIFPKPAAASVALVEAMRPVVTTGHQFTPIAPAPPRYTWTWTTNPSRDRGCGRGGGEVSQGDLRYFC